MSIPANLHAPNVSRAARCLRRAGRSAARWQRVKVGDPLEKDTVVGPLISSGHRDRVEGYIGIGKTEGAEVVAGGTRPDHLERGWYVEPTLLAGATNDMRIAQEEIFGPVIVAIPFDDEDEGTALANGTEFGLYDYVWSADTARAMRVAKRLRSTSASTLCRVPTDPSAGSESGVGATVTFGLHGTRLPSVVAG